MYSVFQLCFFVGVLWGMSHARAVVSGPLGMSFTKFLCTNDDCISQEVKAVLQECWTEAGLKLWKSCVGEGGVCHPGEEMQVNKCLHGKMDNMSDITVGEFRTMKDTMFSYAYLLECVGDQITLTMQNCTVNGKKFRTFPVQTSSKKEQTSQRLTQPRGSKVTVPGRSFPQLTTKKPVIRATPTKSFHRAVQTPPTTTTKSVVKVTASTKPTPRRLAAFESVEVPSTAVTPAQQLSTQKSSDLQDGVPTTASSINTTSNRRRLEEEVEETLTTPQPNGQEIESQGNGKPLETDSNGKTPYGHLVRFPPQGASVDITTPSGQTTEHSESTTEGGSSSTTTKGPRRAAVFAEDDDDFDVTSANDQGSPKFGDRVPKPSEGEDNATTTLPSARGSTTDKKTGKLETKPGLSKLGPKNDSRPVNADLSKPASESNVTNTTEFPRQALHSEEANTTSEEPAVTAEAITLTPELYITFSVAKGQLKGLSDNTTKNFTRQAQFEPEDESTTEDTTSPNLDESSKANKESEPRFAELRDSTTTVKPDNGTSNSSDTTPLKKPSPTLVKPIPVPPRAAQFPEDLTETTTTGNGTGENGAADATGNPPSPHNPNLPYWKVFIGGKDTSTSGPKEGRRIPVFFF